MFWYIFLQLVGYLPDLHLARIKSAAKKISCHLLDFVAFVEALVAAATAKTCGVTPSRLGALQ
jgi:branched-subunit amino acid aminotransferase/4-amino-4-deoxychorismate lyase